MGWDISLPEPAKLYSMMFNGEKSRQVLSVISSAKKVLVVLTFIQVVAAFIEETFDWTLDVVWQISNTSSIEDRPVKISLMPIFIIGIVLGGLHIASAAATAHCRAIDKINAAGRPQSAEEGRSSAVKTEEFPAASNFDLIMDCAILGVMTIYSCALKIEDWNTGRDENVLRPNFFAYIFVVLPRACYAMGLYTNLHRAVIPLSSCYSANRTPKEARNSAGLTNACGVVLQRIFGVWLLLASTSVMMILVQCFFMADAAFLLYFSGWPDGVRVWFESCTTDNSTCSDYDSFTFVAPDWLVFTFLVFDSFMLLLAGVRAKYASSAAFHRGALRPSASAVLVPSPRSPRSLRRYVLVTATEVRLEPLVLWTLDVLVLVSDAVMLHDAKGSAAPFVAWVALRFVRTAVYTTRGLGKYARQIRALTTPHMRRTGLQARSNQFWAGDPIVSDEDDFWGLGGASGDGAAEASQGTPSLVPSLSGARQRSSVLRARATDAEEEAALEALAGLPELSQSGVRRRHRVSQGRRMLDEHMGPLLRRTSSLAGTIASESSAALPPLRILCIDGGGIKGFAPRARAPPTAGRHPPSPTAPHPSRPPASDPACQPPQ